MEMPEDMYLVTFDPCHTEVHSRVEAFITEHCAKDFEALTATLEALCRELSDQVKADGSSFLDRFARYYISLSKKLISLSYTDPVNAERMALKFYPQLTSDRRFCIRLTSPSAILWRKVVDPSDFDVTCPVCFEEGVEIETDGFIPVLACGHRLCVFCCFDILNHGHRSCPTCRAMIEV